MTHRLSAWALATLVLILPWPHRLVAAEGTGKASPAATETPAASVAEATAPAGGVGTNEFSRGGVTLKLMDSVKADQKRLDELLQRLKDPQSEYAEAEKSVGEIKARIEALKAQLAQLDKEGQAPPAELMSQYDSLRKKLELAEARFATALEERKALQEQIAILQKKLAQDQAILARLTGETTAGETNAVLGAATEAPLATSETAGPTPETPPSAPMIPGPMGAAVSRVTAAATASNPPPTGASVTKTQMMTLQLREAKDKESAKQAEAARALEGVRMVQEKILVAEKETAAEDKLLSTARSKLQVAEQEKATLEQDLQRKEQGTAPPTELEALRAKIQDAERRIQSAQAEIKEHEQRSAAQRAELEELKRLEALVAKDADAKQEEAASAQARVQRLENPLNPRNVLRWMSDRGPIMLLTLFLMVLGTTLVSLLGRRAVKLVARATPRGTLEDRMNRAATLVGVFQSTATLVIIAGGLLLLLDQAGVPVGPLLGGAAILGLAVAFGAQRLFADFFHGFVMILENQYKVNDVIKVAGISGLVERISIRVTVLRDLEGILHFIPNSEIKTVSNMTHGWSRALFEIGVAYKEDADRVMGILKELGQGLRQDPEFGRLILDDPEMLGLDAMADSAIVIKFFIKTRPLKQWTVKREMLRRIKRRFDELGIEIPFPHRTVYLRTESTPPIESEPQVVESNQRQPRQPKRIRRRGNTASPKRSAS